MEEQYKSIVRAIIDKQSNVIGRDMAIKKANNVPGIEVDSDGTVLSIKGDYKKILEDLVGEYSLLSGDIAIKFCKDAIKEIIEKYTALNIPDILK